MKIFYILFIVFILTLSLNNIIFGAGISSDKAKFSNRNDADGLTLTDTYDGEKIGNGTISSSPDIFAVVYAWINFFLGLLGLIMLLVIIVSGVMVLTAGTDEAKAKKWMKVLVNITIAFLILLFSYVIVRFLTGGFISDPLK